MALLIFISKLPILAVVASAESFVGLALSHILSIISRAASRSFVAASTSAWVILSFAVHNVSKAAIVSAPTPAAAKAANCADVAEFAKSQGALEISDIVASTALSIASAP